LRDYTLETMEGHRLNRLVSMCMKCHEEVHVDAFGVRNNVDETEAKLKAMSNGRLP
jgi:hypothetical protein